MNTLALAMMVAQLSTPRAARAAAIMATLDSPVNFTNVRPALPTGPTVTIIYSTSFTFSVHDVPRRLDGTSVSQPPAVYGLPAFCRWRF